MQMKIKIKYLDLFKKVAFLSVKAIFFILFFTINWHRNCFNKIYRKYRGDIDV